MPPIVRDTTEGVDPEHVTAPETRYARSGDVHIAYQVVGDGPIDLVGTASGPHHIGLAWEDPSEARFFSRLGSISRLLLFDKRGTGMSDPIPGVPTLEARMDDIRAVMDAAPSERAVLWGPGDTAPLCVLFAATYPERTLGLILFNAFPRFVRSPDMPWLRTRTEVEQRIDELTRRFGEQAYREEEMARFAPSRIEEERRRAVRIRWLSTSPGALSAYLRMNLDVDVRDILPLVRVPTLVMHRRDVAFPPGTSQSGRYLAERIPGARLIELPGADFPPPFGDQEQLFGELERFLAEVVGGDYEVIPDRVLATVLFTDIVGATERAAELGDRAYRELLERHHGAVRAQLGRFRGTEMDTAGDGFFATFDGPARAIRCAFAIRDSLRKLDIDVRAGLHTGECELVDGKAGGIAVHIGARVVGQAGPGEVFVSSTVKDLVAGSGIVFDDRGVATLKGVPGEWRLYAVTDVAEV
jgi:class 3 adenylate cyclase/pimeloyl-ACP methyl ester carboxylesterase